MGRMIEAVFLGPLLGMVIFEPEMLLCPKHREPFRSQWPKGYGIMALKLVQAVLARTDFQQACNGELSIETVGAALRKKPACEWVDKQTLLELYRESGIGVTGHCVGCGQLVRGTPYRTKNYWGRIKTIPHICFHCLLCNTVAPEQN
jgi:hypothetical protein